MPQGSCKEQAHQACRLLQASIATLRGLESCNLDPTLACSGGRMRNHEEPWPRPSIANPHRWHHAAAHSAGLLDEGRSASASSPVREASARWDSVLEGAGLPNRRSANRLAPLPTESVCFQREVALSASQDSVQRQRLPSVVASALPPPPLQPSACLLNAGSNSAHPAKRARRSQISGRSMGSTGAQAQPCLRKATSCLAPTPS